MKAPVALLFCVFLSHFVQQSTALSVTCGDTTYEGVTEKFNNTRNIESFYGVPFAEAPTGEQRFMPPHRKRTNGTIFCDRFKPACIQPTGAQVNKFILNRGFGNTDADTSPFMSEDCLFANIFTPSINPRKKMDVVVYVGGDGITGSSRSIYYRYLLQRDVILVTMQYRLGVFGFLCMQHTEAPCNAGVLDVLEFFKWLNCVIGCFGGNPNSVTAIGHNMGAIIINHLSIGGHLKGLVHKQILLSGSSFQPSALDLNPIASAEKFMKYVDCKANETDNNAMDAQTSLSKMISCLKEKTPEHVMTSYALMCSEIPFPGFLPAITSLLPGGVLSVHPRDAVRSGAYTAIPTLAGTTTNDASRMVNYLQTILDNMNLTRNAAFIRFELVEFTLNLFGIGESTDAMIDSIECRFFSYVSRANRGTFLALVPGLRDMLTFFCVKAPLAEFLKYLSRNTNAYLFNLQYKGRAHEPGSGINDPGGLFTNGTAIYADKMYIFPGIITSFNFNAMELRIFNAILNSYCNFIFTTDPVQPFPINGTTRAVWPKYDMTLGRYLSINPTTAIRVLENYVVGQSTPAIREFLGQPLD